MACQLLHRIIIAAPAGHHHYYFVSTTMMDYHQLMVSSARPSSVMHYRKMNPPKDHREAFEHNSLVLSPVKIDKYHINNVVREVSRINVQNSNKVARASHVPHDVAA
jgi:hypothetical protein